MKKQILVSVFAVLMILSHTYQMFTRHTGSDLVFVDLFLILAWGYIIYLYNKD